MTTYILAGGEDRKVKTYGPALAAEITKRTGGSPYILGCHFGVPQTEWRQKVENWTAWFTEHFGRNITYELADPDEFVEQIKHADVVYLHGGDNLTMIDALKRYPGLSDCFKGKVVVGSSAGAYALVRYSWGRSNQKIQEGTGILQLDIIGHYGVDDPDGPKTDWANIEQRITKLSGVRPMRIREGQFEVVQR